MCRPPSQAGRNDLELADVVAQWQAMGDHPPLAPVQQRALMAIRDCRTARLGAQVRICDHCGGLQVRYHSCRNRHCPKCQVLTKERWLAARRDELLPVPYFHLVFTLPHDLNPLAQGNSTVLYTLLFRCVSSTLQAFGDNPRWLGGRLGFTLVLHTWGQNLSQHIHIHAIVTGGALDEQGQWLSAKPGFLFPVRALSRVFRGKFIAGLKQAYAQQALHFAGKQTGLIAVAAFNDFIASLYHNDWIVYAKQPFAGPQQVLDYLGQYTHRVAITNHRLIEIKTNQVRFYWRDRAHGNQQKSMSLDLREFMRRFVLHILPTGFMRIRHYGVLANRNKGNLLTQCRDTLQVSAPEVRLPESVAAFVLRVLRIDIHRCPLCHTGHLHPLPGWSMNTGPP
ncbi:MAG: hypothetical protein A2W28_08210 [Gammaproteobacteria bacterium RBG_16_51_14]|nr:MAG: hypothetical protein A2W28_08210 [Gammaproteobacteria bacterium RBG_16_51_14]